MPRKAKTQVLPTFKETGTQLKTLNGLCPSSSRAALETLCCLPVSPHLQRLHLKHRSSHLPTNVLKTSKAVVEKLWLSGLRT